LDQENEEQVGELKRESEGLKKEESVKTPLDHPIRFRGDLLRSPEKESISEVSVKIELEREEKVSQEYDTPLDHPVKFFKGLLRSPEKLGGGEEE
jgi:hypothetical protein